MSVDIFRPFPRSVIDKVRPLGRAIAAGALALVPLTVGCAPEIQGSSIQLKEATPTGYFLPAKDTKPSSGNPAPVEEPVFASEDRLSSRFDLAIQLDEQLAQAFPEKFPLSNSLKNRLTQLAVTDRLRIYNDGILMERADRIDVKVMPPGEKVQYLELFISLGPKAFLASPTDQLLRLRDLLTTLDEYELRDRGRNYQGRMPDTSLAVEVNNDLSTVSNRFKARRYFESCQILYDLQKLGGDQVHSQMPLYKRLEESTSGLGGMSALSIYKQIITEQSDRPHDETHPAWQRLMPYLN